ncbi:MAG: DUF1501 domain-containing protein, partial [Planctomycetia bacterium]|nr:DUF1501 domain-containing protein [Planctomycetia bacterium]
MSDRVNRRSLLGIGALGLGGLTLADVLRAEPPAPVAAPKSVVFVFLSGGAPQHDTFDPKPDAPDFIRGEFRPIATRTPGIDISEHLQLLAQRSHLWALCRSLTHKSDDHDAAHQIMLSGRSELPPGFLGFQSQATNWPSIAALANSAVRGREELPPAIVLPEKIIRTDNMQPWSGQFAGLLGARWDPWFIEAAVWCQRGWGPCPNCYEGFINDGTPNRHTAQPIFQPPAMTLPEDISIRRLSDRTALLSLLDGQRQLMEHAAAVGEYDHYARKAVSLLAGRRTHEAIFDVVHADDSTLDRYGRNKYGWSALLAGRLIEAGVRLVQVNFGKASSWDTHVANFELLKNILLPPADRALSALLDDLEDRGLLASTLVVVASEFGRTPKINNAPKAGRDHWGAVQSVLFAGAGVRGGTVVGSSDRIGGHPASDPQTPENLAATIYQTLGIPRASTWTDTRGRRHQFYHGDPIAAL